MEVKRDMMKISYRYVLFFICIISIVYIQQNTCFACHEKVQMSENKKEKTPVVADVEKEIAIIYDHFSDDMQMITNMIEDKMLVDTYSIQDYKSIDIADYDLIIIGSSVIDN